jgi:hypothetical protein
VEVFKRFGTSIANNKTLANFRMVIRGDLDTLASIKGKHMPTKGFKIVRSLDLTANESFLNLVEILTSTNVNKLGIYEEFVLDDAATVQSALPGFSEFCNHVIKQNTLKEWLLQIFIDDFTLPYLAKVIANTTILRILDIVFSAKVPEKPKSCWMRWRRVRSDDCLSPVFRVDPVLAKLI